MESETSAATIGPDDLRFKIAATRRMLYREGCDSNVGGHVSARANGEAAFWATGFEYFDQTHPLGVAKLNYALEVIDGELSFSPALNSATMEALVAEQSARYHLECVAIGGTPILENEVVAGRAMYFQHFIPNMWDSNVARLKLSDPDLFE